VSIPAAGDIVPSQPLSPSGAEAALRAEVKKLKEELRRQAEEADTILFELMKLRLNFDRLEEGEFIGGGHFSQCFLAKFKETPDGKSVKEVVIKKFLNPDKPAAASPASASSASVPERPTAVSQMKEAKMLQRTSGHPNFLVLVGYLYGDGARDNPVPERELWVVTERALYGDLEKLFQTNHSIHRARNLLLTPTCTTFIVGELLTALDHLHTKLAWIHRDIALRNLLFDRNGRVILSDLGLTREEDDAYVPKTATPSLQPPEVSEGKASSRAADIWMVGTTIVEMLTGKRLDVGISRDWRAVESQIRNFKAKLDPKVYALIPQLLSVEADRRPTAQAALAALGGLYDPLRPSPCLLPLQSSVDSAYGRDFPAARR